jgi:7-cyano-7-deazaguanine reductase
MATFVVDALSPNLVESKSFKLYLNSFNQTELASPESLRQRLLADIGSACGLPVDVELKLPGEFDDERIEEMDGELIDGIDVEVRDYRPNPALLRTGQAEADETLVSNLLKTNCPLTGQPDWASIQIRYRGPRIDRAGLLRYLVSFRQHGGFHEQCVENIFVDILGRCAPERLSVYARYTRRGGLDINPFRTNRGEKTPQNVRTARQ